MEIARRNRIDQYTPAETAIREAMQAVEAAGCDPLLTDAVVLLGQAKDKVADFVDGAKKAATTEAEIQKVRAVRLLTTTGGYVVSGQIPAFNEPPAVMVWGERFFQYNATDDEGVDVYVEAFTYVLNSLPFLK